MNQFAVAHYNERTQILHLVRPVLGKGLVRTGMFADTIAYTPLQPSGFGIVSLVLHQSSVGSIFQPSHGGSVANRNRKLRHGWLNIEGQLVDEAMLVVMRTHILHCRRCCGIAVPWRSSDAPDGVAANSDVDYTFVEPGEFTHRAFLNGRLDLTRVEAIADLIQDSRMSFCSPLNEEGAIRDHSTTGRTHPDCFAD